MKFEALSGIVALLLCIYVVRVPAFVMSRVQCEGYESWSPYSLVIVVSCLCASNLRIVQMCPTPIRLLTFVIFVTCACAWFHACCRVPPSHRAKYTSVTQVTAVTSYVLRDVFRTYA
jgi:hypothetical protein